MKTKFETIANLSRLDIIKKSCGQSSIDLLDSILEKSLSEINKPIVKIFELFSSIDNVSNLDLNELPLYSTGTRRIHVINNSSDSEKAVKDILNHRIIGFDTEQKPTFVKGAIPNGTALIQIATKSDCYIFQVKLIKNIRPILSILENTSIIKVGSGLRGDKSTLSKEFKVSLKKTIDLGSLFKSKLGHEFEIGIKKAVASILGKRITKSKKMSTSNWEKTNLSSTQILYAAEDSFAAYDVFCTLLNKYPFTINVLSPWFQDLYNKDYFVDDLK